MIHKKGNFSCLWRHWCVHHGRLCRLEVSYVILLLELRPKSLVRWRIDFGYGVGERGAIIKDRNTLLVVACVDAGTVSEGQCELLKFEDGLRDSELLLSSVTEAGGNHIYNF